jgi:hypothetical protein
MKAVLILLLLCVSYTFAAKICIDATTTNCTGTLTCGSASSGACEAQDDASAKLTCDSSASTSNWTVQTFATADCTGTAATTDSGTGTECVSLAFALGLYGTVDCGACFSGNAMVTLESGDVVPMSQLEVGDKVLSIDSNGKLFFDRVFRITHNDAEETRRYVVLSTEDGHRIEMAGNHYLHSGSCCELDSMVLAADVQEGDTIYVNYDGTLEPVTVAKVAHEQHQGAHNVHTLNGNIIVNGIATSHFTTESMWKYPSWAPAWYKFADFVGATDRHPQELPSFVSILKK